MPNPTIPTQRRTVDFNPVCYQYNNTGAASDKISNILRAAATAIDSNSDSGGILVDIPSLYPHDRSPWVYVAVSRTFIYSQRLVTTDDLQKEVPRSFEQLGQELLDCSASPDASNEGLMGFYIAAIGGRLGPLPTELRGRNKVFIL